MLKPKKTKFLKYYKLRVKRNEYRSTTCYKLFYGNFGLQASENGILTPQQIEATRRTLVKNIGQFGKVWIRIFPHYIITNKPKEVRMGRGKGDFKTYAAGVKTGRILYEIIGTNTAQCVLALKKAMTKLPIKCQVVTKL